MTKERVVVKKWKCKVCHEIIETETQPKKCPFCNADQHKIKEVRYGKRSKSGLELAESED